VFTDYIVFFKRISKIYSTKTLSHHQVTLWRI